MTKKMLIDASQKKELRVAIITSATAHNEPYLYDLNVETTAESEKPQKANIYKGRITRIEPSLEAAFVDYGSSRQGFLPLKEIAPEYFVNNPPADGSRPNIKQLLKEGQELDIQIAKEERGTKGAALTTFLTLAGRYLVLMPNNPEAGGISRRIEGDERDELRDTLNSLQLPSGMGVIVRTAGMGKSIDDLQWDLDSLIGQWERIKKTSQQHSAPYLIQEEGDVVIRSIRDNLSKDIDEIIINTSECFIKSTDYIRRVQPDFVANIKLYQDEQVPLFSRYQIEKQIETAYQREVRLPSGGSIVIDPTEALVSIDINSAKATGGSDIENTALETNREAAVEIARQLRLRDLGGLIVIDFIDMGPVRNQRDVENCLRDALRTDRARVQIGRISRFGLLEMSRQRLRSALNENTQDPCPRCGGRGSIRGVQSLTSSLIRLIEEAALNETTGQVQVQAPTEVATVLMNEKRDAITLIEKRHNVDVMIIPNIHLETPHYKFVRVRKDEIPSAQQRKASYQIVEPLITDAPGERERITPIAAAPVPPQAPTQKAKTPRKSWLKRLWESITGGEKKTQKTTSHRGKHQGHQRRGGGQQRGQQRHRSRRGSQQSRGPRQHDQRRRQQPRGGNQQRRHGTEQAKQQESSAKTEVTDSK